MQCEHEFKLFHTRYGVGEWCIKCKATREEAEAELHPILTCKRNKKCHKQKN